LARPAWLIEAPLQLKVQRHQPVYISPLKLIAGPERIEAGWWDDASIARDYFIAENALGQLLWIYREHDPAARSNSPGKGNGWYLQGLFG
jgi:protein ImuB